MKVILNFISKFFSRWGLILLVAVIAGICSQAAEKRRKKTPGKLLKEPYGYNPLTDEPLNIMFSNAHHMAAYILYAFGIVFAVGSTIVIILLLPLTARLLYAVFVPFIAAAAVFMLPARALSCRYVYYNSKQIFVRKFSGSFDAFSWEETAVIEPTVNGFLLKDLNGKTRVRAVKADVGYDEFKQLAKRSHAAGSDYI